MQKRSKKGFTLAELLIVVAIIAVLVAIAVPLFVGSLNKAQKARDDANIRAVRGAAVVYLLEKSDDEELWPETVVGWTVEATISSTGDITNMTVTHASTATDACPADGKVTNNGDTFTVGLYLKTTEVKDLPTVTG